MNTNCLESKGKGCSLDYFEKNAYFHGKLMTARDMLAEQVMHEGKLYTVNRFMLGDGLVCGLQTENLRVENGKLLVDIKPGMGLDCCGRLIVVRGTGAVVTKEVKQMEKENESGYPEPMHLYIRYKECLKEAVPIPGVGDACEEKCCYNRILEVFDVVYSVNPPSTSSSADVHFPSESDYDNNSDRALLKIGREYYTTNLKSGCNDCTASLIFLGTFMKKQNGDAWELDETTTSDHLKVVYTNTMLYDIITRHVSRFNNPHNVNAEDTGALISINDVSNHEGNIDLVADHASTITITPDEDSNSIIIGEDHSARTDNPHDVKPVQIGALASINNVKSLNTNINFLSPDGSISITPGIESINLSLSSALLQRISSLEAQVTSMQRYLMDKSLKYKLKVFSDIQERFGSVSAGKIVERVKEELNNRIYTDPEKYLMLLKELWEREMTVSKEIKDKVTEESLKKYLFSLENLLKSIKAGNISQAAVEQDEVCEMAEWLESALEMVIVPDVVEKDIEEAKKAIQDAGLLVGRISEQFSELEPGVVIKQEPAPGTSVPVHSTVDLLVATEVAVPVPDVLHMTITDARLAIEKGRLYVGTITEEPSSVDKPGTVIRQSPEAGSMVGVNSAVDLVVAAKPTMSVPNVVNMDLFDAKQAIEKAGLVVGSIVKEPSTTKPDIVLKQNPEAGTSVIVNSPVDLVLSTEMSVSVPKVIDMNVSDAMLAIEKAGLVVGTIKEEPLVFKETLVIAEPIFSREPLVAREPVLSAGTTISKVPLVPTEPALSGQPLPYKGPLTFGEPLAIPTGIVIRQNPAPGTVVPLNTQVNLVISKESTGSVAVPDVVNMDVSSAKLAIEKAGLVVGTIKEEPLVFKETLVAKEPLVSAGTTISRETVLSTESLVANEPIVSAGTTISREPLLSREPVLSTEAPVSEAILPSFGRVIRQSPAAGTMVPLKSAVNLVVSAGVVEKVPDVTGLKVEDAKATIEATGFTVGKETPTISKTKDIGTVSTQSPIPGMEKPQGSAVDIRVVSVPVSAPNVIGEYVEDAKVSIDNAGLVVGKIEPVRSEGEPGTVIYQSPTESHTIAAGSTVNLNVVAETKVMAGTEAMTTIQPEKMVMTTFMAATEPQKISTVPNVVNKNVDYAKVIIENAGLSVDSVTEAVSNLKSGTVLEMFPAADSRTPAGSKVDILVAVKEEVIVPDVTGLSLDEAKKRILEGRLQVATWFSVPSSQPQGITIQQEPVAGSGVEIGSGVSLWVSA